MNMLNISEAASLGLHAMMRLAASGGRMVTVREIAEELSVSEHHLAKVMARLARAGLVKSLRGPSGGFALGRDRDDITLLEVFEAIEGPISMSGCLFEGRVCMGENCILGGLIEEVNRSVRDYLAGARLSRPGAKPGVYRARRDPEDKCFSERGGEDEESKTDYRD